MLKRPLAAFAGVAILASPLAALPDDTRGFQQRDWRWERQPYGQVETPTAQVELPKAELPKADSTKAVEPASNPSNPASKPASNATGKHMGHGSADTALALAKASLAKLGIHNPTREQLNAALHGGTITTKSGERVKLPGVLKLRASGMGWGQVAHKLGLKVGDVKGHHKHARHHDRDDDDDRHHHHRKHSKHDKHDKHDHKHAKHHKHDHKYVKHHHHRPEFHRAKFERPERVERPEKVERPHRPERPERPERHRHRH